MKIYQHDTGHMTKMAGTPIQVKNPSNILLSGTSGPSGFSFVADIRCRSHH